jgi:hypothetical protein
MAPRGLPQNTSGMASTGPQGWFDDPFRLHEARYFSAGRPTKLVRDGDVESYDEPPGEGVPGSGAAAASGHAVSRTPNRAEADDPNPSGDGVSAYGRRRPRVGMRTAVAVIAIAGVVTAAVIVGKSRPATVPATEAMAYTATMNARSADVLQIYAATTGDHKFDSTITAFGPVSWSANQGKLAGTMIIGGRQSLALRQIIDGRKTYSKIVIKGVPASALAGLPGVSWMERNDVDRRVVTRSARNSAQPPPLRGPVQSVGDLEPGIPAGAAPRSGQLGPEPRQRGLGRNQHDSLPRPHPAVSPGCRHCGGAPAS